MQVAVEEAEAIILAMKEATACGKSSVKSTGHAVIAQISSGPCLTATSINLGSQEQIH